MSGNSTLPLAVSAAAGRRVREAREARNWPQARLARCLYTSPSRMSKLETGTAPWHAWELAVTADLLGTEAETLTGGMEAEALAEEAEERAMFAVLRAARMSVVEAGAAVGVPPSRASRYEAWRLNRDSGGAG